VRKGGENGSIPEGFEPDDPEKERYRESREGKGGGEPMTRRAESEKMLFCYSPNRPRSPLERGEGPGSQRCRFCPAKKKRKPLHRREGKGPLLEKPSSMEKGKEGF